MWNKFRYHLARLAARFEFPGALGEVALLALERQQLLSSRHRLTVTSDQLGLIVERVDLAARTGAEDHEDVLGFGGKV